MTVTDDAQLADMAMTTMDLPAGPFPLPVDAAGLTIPRLRVVPIDGDPYTVQAYQPDLVLWEETAAARKWKANTPGNAPFKWLAFLAWAASRRTGRIPDTVTWDAFLAGLAQVTDATTADDVARPTPPGPGPG
jgi:hypothetical protein